MTAGLLDFNSDGWSDIYVACDSTPSILYRNNKNGTFTDLATERGVAYSEDGREQAGMGLALPPITTATVRLTLSKRYLRTKCLHSIEMTVRAISRIWPSPPVSML